MNPVETEDRPLAAYTFQCCGARAAYGLPVNLDEPMTAKASKGLLDWTRGRESMHRCELVSAENPFGWEDRVPA